MEGRRVYITRGKYRGFQGVLKGETEKSYHLSVEGYKGRKSTSTTLPKDRVYFGRKGTQPTDALTVLKDNPGIEYMMDMLVEKMAKVQVAPELEDDMTEILRYKLTKKSSTQDEDPEQAVVVHKH